MAAICGPKPVASPADRDLIVDCNCCVDTENAGASKRNKVVAGRAWDFLSQLTNPDLWLSSHMIFSHGLG